MGSTATNDPQTGAGDKGKQVSDKAGAAGHAAAQTSPADETALPRNRQAGECGSESPRAGKAAPAESKAAGKRGNKTGSATGKTVKTGNPEPQTGEPAADTDRAIAPAVPAPATNQTSEDSRSISWMSAQAISALNAVKASQARKAESLLARVEKPVPGRPAITELPEQTSEDLLDEFSGVEATAPAARDTLVQREATPASAGDNPTIQKEGTFMQEKPGEQEPTNAATEAAAIATESAAASTSPETGATAGTAATMTAPSQRRELPVRAIVMTVFLLLLAFSGYRYWQENRESGVVAPPPTAGGYSSSVREADWDDIPQQSAIAVVGTSTGEQGTHAAPEPDDAARATPQTWTPAGSQAATAPSTAATADNTGSVAAQAAAETAPPPPAETEMATPQPAGASADEPTQMATPQPAGTSADEPTQTESPAQPQAAAVATPPVSPAQRQPRYGAPGYGYYPQQPAWQQPYYQPGYPQQYPSR
jgi:hypothetical protein